MRRAKIVCTIGPACDSEECIRDLMNLGMDVARLNFSHGTHSEHARRIQRLRRVARSLKRTICILQDLQGPKIRTGRLKNGQPVELETGSVLTITPRKVPGTAALISTDFAGLAREVEPGARVLLSDGRIELRVRAIHGDDVECEVRNGGMLAEQQGINLPGAAVSIPVLTEKDKLDLKFGLAHGVDAIALSFVRSADDLRMAEDLMRKYGKSVPIIAKLEKPQAIERLEEILEVANGVMIARGDLGVELPPEQVPIIQKRVIQRAALWRKPVITATQMLESMTESPRPTRAEASNVANAIFDGTDAVMLSGETASGHYPRESGGYDGTDHRRGRNEHRANAARGEPPREPSLFGGRNYLRVDRACRGRFTHWRNRRFYRERQHGAHALQAPAQGSDLRVQPPARSLQPDECALGRASDPQR